jgi:hypothetical protein
MTTPIWRRSLGISTTARPWRAREWARLAASMVLPSPGSAEATASTWMPLPRPWRSRAVPTRR